MLTVPVVTAAAITGLLTLSPAGHSAQPRGAGAVRVEHGWIRLPPAGAPTAAAYLVVTNLAPAADRLLGGVTPEASSVEPHTMSMAGGVMRMRQAATGLAIAPRATLTLAPGGDHLMLVAPKPGLKIGDHVPVTLRFAHAGAVKTEFIVRADAPASPVMAMPGMPSR